MSDSLNHLTIDWFDVLDSKDRPVLSDKEILSNLQAIVKDGDKTPVRQVASNALGILTTESRKIWSHLRTELQESNRNNANSLLMVESALFVVCLDDYEPDDIGELCGNFLCGSYRLDEGVQVGTCTNRWYDKVGQARGYANVASNHCLLQWRSRHQL